MSTGSAEAVPAPDPEQLNRRMMTLGQQALEGRRELSDLLGDAFSELQAAVRGMRDLRAELQRRDEVIAGLRAAARVDGARSLAGSVSAAPDAPFANGNGATRARVVAAPPVVPAERPELTADLFERFAPAGAEALQASLRARIAGALFLGTLRGGDGLPSIRELARRTGLNHKTVRRVYRELERSGLVEVRDRSGIYVAESGSPVAGEPGGVEGWMAEVLVEAIGHGIGAAELPALLERSVGARRLRCACVDSTEDDRFALCHELERWFGLQSYPVAADAEDLDRAIAGAELVVSTPFHADEVRRALRPDQPLVVAGLHPAAWQAVHADPSGGPVSLVCVDPASGERLRRSAGDEAAQRVRVVAVDALDGSGASGPWIVTLAARERLGRDGPSGTTAVPPYLSGRTAGQIARLVVRLNLQAPPPG